MPVVLLKTPPPRLDFTSPADNQSEFKMSLGQMDPALVCSGPMSNLSYDSHIVTRLDFISEMLLVQPKTFLTRQAADG